MYNNSSLDLHIISATNLWTVEEDAHVFVVATLISNSDEPTATQSTTTASAINTNPITWNSPIQFLISDSFVTNYINRAVISLQLRCQIHHGDFTYEEEIGEIYLQVADLLDIETRGLTQFVTYNICNEVGAPIGELNLSYKFTDDGDSRRLWAPTPSAPPLPPPPDPPPLGPRGRARGFQVKMAIVFAAAVVVPQMGGLLVKVQELVVAFFALALVFLVVFGFLVSLPGLLQQFAASRNHRPTAARVQSGHLGSD